MHFSLASVAFLSCLLLWPPSATAVAIASPTTSLLISQNVNISLISANVRSGIPSDFKVDQDQARGDEVNDKACLNQAVWVLADLAQNDFTQEITAKAWSLGGVTIAVTLYGTRPGTRGIQTRYVVWGIYKALQDMLATRDFRGVVYRLKWRGLGVGALAIYKPQQLTASSNHVFQDMKRKLLSNLPELNNTLLTLTNDSSTNSSDRIVFDDESLEVFFLALDPPDRPARDMNPYGVYLNMLGLLVFAAEQSSSAAISAELTVSAPETKIRIIVAGPQTSKPLTRPPYFTWNFLCRALRTTSRILIESDYFKEFKVQLKVNHVEIGNIIFEPTPDPAVAGTA